MDEIKVKVPLQPVLDKRYLKLKPYFDDFVERVNKQNIDVNKYDVVITIEEKKSELDRSSFNI